MFEDRQRHFMRMALREAELAQEHDDVPIGAVIVCNDKIIAKGHNQINLLNDPTAHAEIIAITSAAAHLERDRLEGCDMYVTAEPCLMCAGALLLARIDRIYFGVFEPKFGACGSQFNVIQSGKYNHTPEIYSGLLEEECQLILRQFFRNVRTNNNSDLKA
jgi:tRNA(adenine34) deaminase